MIRKIAVIVGGLVFAVSLTHCNKKGETRLMTKARSTFGTIPDHMPNSENDTADMISLGKDLYFDDSLSVNDSQSCNSCHRLDEGLGGVDNSTTSKGAKGEMGGRNAPTVLNAGFQIAQFWDGRAKDLKEQAKGPILNPIEMGMHNEGDVLEKIKEVKDYQDRFKKVFPDSGINYENLAQAIAAFERTLVTQDRFDKYMEGDDSALTDEEKKGLQLFMDTGCSSCHSGPLLGGNSYQKFGVVRPYTGSKDMGKYEVTKKEEDKMMFKVPMLRNIAITGPYFHDGKTEKLEDAVRTMASIQLGKELNDEEVKSIVTFLNTLTDIERAK